MWTDQPPKLWVPPKPAIIRPAADLRHSHILVPPIIFRLAAAGAASAVTWRSSGQQASVAANPVFSSLSFGADFAGRYMFVLAQWVTNAQTVNTSAISIGGVAASKLVEQISGPTRQQIWYASGISVSSGNVNVTTSGACEAYGVDVFSASLTSTAAQDSEAVSANNQNLSNTGITAPAGSSVIGGRITTAGAGASFTWTGLTEDSDRTVGSGIGLTAAHVNLAAAASPLTITCNANVGLTSGSFLAVCVK